MSARRPPRDADELLRDGGGEIGDLYRRLPRYEPPRRLDRAVLGEAARAVHSGKAPRRQRWVLGIGSAAGVVLAAGIAWRIGHDAMTPSETDPGAAAPRVVPVQPITESARARHEQAAAPAPPEPAMPADAASSAKPSAGAAREAFADRAKASRRREETRVAEPAQKQATPPAPPPAAAARPSAFPGAAQRPESNDRLGTPAPSGAVSRQDEEKDLPHAPAAARALAPMTSPSSSVELQRDLQLAPQDWLSHIRQLRRQGRLQQARESLSLFERTHPDWVVPDELRDLRD